MTWCYFPSNLNAKFQDLSSYPIIGSQLFSGVNGTAGIINPALCQNPNFISSSLPELSGIKSEKSIEGSPDHSLASVSKFDLLFELVWKGSKTLQIGLKSSYKLHL